MSKIYDLPATTVYIDKLMDMPDGLAKEEFRNVLSAYHQAMLKRDKRTAQKIREHLDIKLLGKEAPDDSARNTSADSPGRNSR